jgi:carboxylate-amine ligase
MESINLPRQIWWKIRPHAHYGTVEFRVCDIQRSLARTRMLVALSQAICHRIDEEYRAGKLVQDMEIEFINDAVWKATRFGFDAKVTDVDGSILTMGELIQKMAEYARPSLEQLGSLDIVPTVENVLAEGSEANQQREIYNEGGFPSLLQMLMREVEF